MLWPAGILSGGGIMERSQKKLTVLRYIRAFLEFIAILGIVFMIAVFAITADSRGAAPPPDSAGLVGSYGMRVVLTWIFLLGGSLIGLIFLTSRFPKLQRFPVEITAKNIEIQYILSKIMLSSIQIVLLNYFGTLMINVYRATIRLASMDFVQMTVAAVAACLAIWLLYYIAARRSK